MFEAIQRIDDMIMIFVHNNIHTQVLDKVMPLITALGNEGAIWIIIALLLLMTKKYRGIGILLLAAVLLGAILGEGILKNIVQRERPFKAFKHVHMLIHKPSSYSFPSGHATAAFAAVSILTRYMKRYAFALWILAIAIAFSRVYLFVHYPSDIIAGMLLGLFSAGVIVRIKGRFPLPH